MKYYFIKQSLPFKNRIFIMKRTFYILMATCLSFSYQLTAQEIYVYSANGNGHNTATMESPLLPISHPIQNLSSTFLRHWPNWKGIVGHYSNEGLIIPKIDFD